jgi:hypothetical protein
LKTKLPFHRCLQPRFQDSRRDHFSNCCAYRWQTSKSNCARLQQHHAARNQSAEDFCSLSHVLTYPFVSQNHISSSHDVKVTLSQPTSDSTLPYFLNSRWLKPMVTPPNTRKPHARPANAKAKGPQLYLNITLADPRDMSIQF